LHSGARRNAPSTRRSRFRAYAIIGTVLLPRLWIDPIGPLLKIWPIMVLILVAVAIHEDR
jgi:hypothetical protein